MSLYNNKSELELAADKLLEDTLKDKSKNKSSKQEYPILSDSQLFRRRRREIPYSSLSPKQQIDVDADVDE